MVSISPHEIDLLNAGVIQWLETSDFGCDGEYFSYVVLAQTAFTGKEFESVSVKWQVAGGKHDGAVAGIIFKDGRHKHCRRR